MDSSQATERADATEGAAAQGPLVSVVIPTHNRAAYAVECARSCLGQTYRHVEVIVVDDGSTDGTPAVLEELSRELDDKRFRYIVQENQGACVARNAGLEASGGKYVKFLDSDDTIDPDAIEHNVAVLEETGADLCIGGRRYMSADGKKESVHYRPPQGWIDEPLLKFLNVEVRIQTGLWVFRRRVFDEALRWDPELVARQEVDVLARALIAGATMAGAPGAITNQRCHAGPRVRSREFSPEGMASIQRMHERLYEWMVKHERLADAGHAFAGYLCRTVVRWWDENREAAKRTYTLAKRVHRRPELVLSDNYSPTTHRVASVAWSVGGPYVCGALLRWYERTKPLQTTLRRRLRRRKAAASVNGN